MTFDTVLLLAGFFLGAALYSSVGHAGASAYLALMALAQIPPAVMRPTALILNILVAGIVSARFALAGAFRWRLLWPFLITALPFAYLGGRITLPGAYYRPLVGAMLVLAAVRILFQTNSLVQRPVCAPPLIPALMIGALIGLISGLTGTGGGIFLSPVMLFMAWGEARTISAVAAVFILGNSLAGFIGYYSKITTLPAELPAYIMAVLAGSLVGSYMGAKYLPSGTILKLLAVVLLIAGIKLLGIAF